MKKLLLLILPLFLFCGNNYAKKPQLARSVWFLFEKQDGLEKQPNDSVVVSYKTVMKSCFPNDPEDGWIPQPHIVIIVQNKSTRTVYVDLQKSFAVINDELYPLYIASSEVQTTSNTSMAGVNLGLIGFGSAGTTANTKITHAERFVIVPEETKKSIEIPLTKWGLSFNLNNVNGRMEFRPAGSNGITDPNHKFYMASNHKLVHHFINNGEVKSYDYGNNPITLDMRLCYSFHEDMTPDYSHRSIYFTKHIIGSDYHNGGKFSNKAATKKALEAYPPLNDYLTSSNKMYFHLWCPEIMPKK